MNKQEALNKIKELENYIKNLGKNPVKMIIERQELEWGETCEKELNWEDAKKWCEKKGNGWRLPTRLELLEAYEQKIDGFSVNDYWSSTENDSLNAWLENFNDGYQVTYSKYNTDYVRCIRSLTI